MLARIDHNSMPPLLRWWTTWVFSAISAMNSATMSISIPPVDLLSLLLCLRNHLLENSRGLIYGGKMMALSTTYFALALAQALGLSSLSSTMSMVLQSRLHMTSSVFCMRHMVGVTTVLQGTEGSTHCSLLWSYLGLCTTLHRNLEIWSSTIGANRMGLHCLWPHQYFVWNLPDDEDYHHIHVAVSSGFTQDPLYYPLFESLVCEVLVADIENCRMVTDCSHHKGGHYCTTTSSSVPVVLTASDSLPTTIVLSLLPPHLRSSICTNCNASGHSIEHCWEPGDGDVGGKKYHASCQRWTTEECNYLT